MMRFICLLMLILMGYAQTQELELSQDAKVLNFSSQGLAALSVEFSDFPDIEVVDLSHNDITDIEPDAFQANTKLRVIDLSGNRKLRFPENGPFLETTASVLNLSNCDIEKVPGNVFDEMRGLDVLDLSGNPIVFEESVAFETMSSPPKRIIVSNVSHAGLKYMCHHADMEVTIVEKHKTVVCKDIRKKQGKKSRSKTRERVEQRDRDVSIEMIEEGLVKDDTHLEMMMSDEPDEGSGNGGEAEIDEDTKDNGGAVKDIPVEVEDNKKDDQKVADGETGVEDKGAKSGTEGISAAEVKSETEAKSVTENKVATDTKDESVDEAKTGVQSETGSKIEPESKDEVKVEDKTRSEVKTDENVGNKDNVAIPPAIVSVEKVDETAAPPQIKPDDVTPSVDDSKNDGSKSKARSKQRSKASKPETTKEDGKVENGDNKEEVMDLNRSEFETVPVVNKTGNGSLDVNANILDNSSIVGESKEASSSSNVILILVIGCVAMGSVLVGYKYYKDKKKPTRPVNGCALEARELKEIRVIKDGSSNEGEPLMKSSLQEISFKEVVPKKEVEECKEPMNTETPVSAMDAICKSNAEIPSIDDEK